MVPVLKIIRLPPKFFRKMQHEINITFMRKITEQRKEYTCSSEKKGIII